MTALEKLIEQAQKEVDADDYRWGNPDSADYGIGQDTEEAEESGRLMGYLQGLEAARDALRSSEEGSTNELLDPEGSGYVPEPPWDDVARMTP